MTKAMTTAPMGPYSSEQIAALPVADLCATLRDQIIQTYGSCLPVIVGIHRGGFCIAQWLHQELECDTPVGSLDISWHRDDLRASSVTPNVKPTRLPVDIDDQEVLLVDDILFTGRTIRAALNELFDYGRPAAVRLAVLGQRDGHQLPIAPDFVACEFDLSDNQQVKLQTSENGSELPITAWQLRCEQGADACK